MPWEDPERYPAGLNRYWETLVQAVTQNVAFADRIPLGQGFLKPWLFLLISTLPLLLAIALVILFAGSLAVALTQMSGGKPLPHLLPVAGFGIGLVLVLFVVLLPLIQFLGVLLGGAVVHLFLWIWGGTRQDVGLDQTIRLYFYGTAVLQLVQLPLQLLGMVPLIGILASLLSLVLSLAFLVVMALALARLHRTEAWRGFCAIFAPLVAICCCLGVAAAILIPVLISHLPPR